MKLENCSMRRDNMGEALRLHDRFESRSTGTKVSQDRFIITRANTPGLSFPDDNLAIDKIKNKSTFTDNPRFLTVVDDDKILSQFEEELNEASSHITEILSESKQSYEYDNYDEIFTLEPISSKQITINVVESGKAKFYFTDNDPDTIE